MELSNYLAMVKMIDAYDHGFVEGRNLEYLCYLKEDYNEFVVGLDL